MSEPQTGPALDPERMEGQDIAGCKIVAKIATGGMGTVYRALQVSMNRQVAIKCLAEDFAKDQAYVTRFVREARAAGELSHTNLIHVLDVGVFHGVYYYLMEFVDGQSLDRVLRIKNNLSPETAVEIMIQAAKALSYAHTHEIIHRDIKPDNLMITKEGTVKIADLGIAKKMDRSKEATDAGLVLGTPNYMAPEQATDASLTDKRSDIYALGSTAYHMLTGRPPYTGKNALEILTNVVKKKPEPIEKYRKDLPKHLLSIINKMMARDPERRFQSMDELVKDLELYKMGKYKSETPSTRPTWDEDDEEGAKPKAVIELAATPEEEAKQSAAVAPSGAAVPGSANSVKLSGTRVSPNPAMGTSDLIGAKAIGAINAKRASKVVPVVTLVGAIVIGLVCWMVYKKLTAPEEKKPVEPSHTTTIQDLGPHAAPGEPEAKEAFAEAEKLERSPNKQRADVLKAYRDIASRWPETVAGLHAGDALKRLEKEWVEAVDSRIAEARKCLAALPDVAPVTPAVEAATRARREAQSRADLIEKVRALEKEIDSAAKTRRDRILATARELSRHARWVEAIDEARKVFVLEYPDYEDEAIKEIGTWRSNWRAEREAANGRTDAMLDKAVVVFRGIDDPKIEMQPDRAAEMVAALTKDSSNLAIKGMLDEYAAIYRDAAGVVDAAFEQAKSMAGQKFKFSKAAFANDAEVTIVDVTRPKVQVQLANGSKISTKPLIHEDILKLARLALGGTNEGKLRLAAYLFARGETGEALRNAAGVPGDAAAKLRARLEDFQIRKRELAVTPKDLIASGGNGWSESAQKGGWTPKEKGLEIEASGDLAERLLGPAPESNYIFETEARKVLGPNGFGVYFKAFGLSYQWHIGDGGNKFSIVRGMPATQTNDTVALGDPVVVRIVALDDKVIGYLNGERRWEITRATAGNPTPGPGAGLAVYHTLVRFLRIRLWELK